MHTCRPLTALYPATTRNIELWAEDDDGTSMFCVATVHPLELPEDGDCEANARLFKAAAEMLTALYEIDSNAAESVEWIRRVTRSAIFKATGSFPS